MKCKFYVNFGLKERLEVLKKKRGYMGWIFEWVVGLVLFLSIFDFFGWKKLEIFEFLYYIDFFDERKMYLLLKLIKCGGNNY